MQTNVGYLKYGTLMNDTCILTGEHHVHFILHSYVTILMLLKDITRVISTRLLFLKIKLKKILKQNTRL